MTIIFICISALSLLLFALMGIDKARARKSARRIPEATLFLLAILGGCPGGIFGMYAFRHKTLHRSFRLGFPLILLCQLALAAFLYLKWKGLIS